MVSSIVGISRSIQRIRELIQRVAGTCLNIVITGESGVGKELIAQTLHNSSQRKNKPFVKVNCAARPKIIQRSKLSQSLSHILSLPFLEFVAQHPSLHPAYGECVAQGPEQPVPDAIFCPTSLARPVIDRQFRDRVTLHRNKLGEKTVHPGEERKPGQTPGAKDLEAASRIVDFLAYECPSDAVGSEARPGRWR